MVERKFHKLQLVSRPKLMKMRGSKGF